MMIANLVCCTPEHTVRQAAEMMVRHDCREIAIVENVENLKPIGVITRPRHCLACSGRRQKPSANERARCYVESSVTVASEPFYGASELNSKGVK